MRNEDYIKLLREENSKDDFYLKLHLLKRDIDKELSKFKIENINLQTIFSSMVGEIKQLAKTLAVTKQISEILSKQHKGIILTGPTGIGKTELLKSIKKWWELSVDDIYPTSWLKEKDIIQSLKEKGDIDSISYNYDEFGNKLTMLFNREGLKFSESQIKTIFLDDAFVQDVNVNHFGTIIKPIESFIESRYDFFKERKILTFITTNLSLDEISQCISNRTYSRIHEMFEVIDMSDFKDLRQS